MISKKAKPVKKKAVNKKQFSKKATVKTVKKPNSSSAKNPSGKMLVKNESKQALKSSNEPEFNIILPKKSVQLMDRYNPPIEGRSGKLRLDFNENTIGPAPRVLDVLRNIKDEDLCVYPEYDSFKKKFANYLNILPSELAITNASDDAIRIVIDTYVEKGDEIILPVPTFVMFKQYGSVAGAKFTEILYKKNLAFPTEKVLSAITKKTRMVVIVNPNNPTGTAVEKKYMIKILEKAKNSIVIVDEAYVQFTGETAADLIGKYPNLVVIRTFSKAFGLAALRLGYIISCSENIKSISKVNSPYSVNMIAVKAASIAIEEDEYMNWFITEIKKGKELMYKELKNLKLKTYPSAANFVLVDFKDRAKEIEEKLSGKGILVRDRSCDPLLKGKVRVSVGTEKQIAAFIESLKEVL